jgi:predicted deacylase
VLSRKLLTFADPALAGETWPCFEAAGAEDGPRLCILAGVHGCEYSGIAAVGRFMRTLDTAELSGSVVAVPIVSPAMFAGRAAFVSPADGKNPNRCFPGDPDGTYSEQLAHHVFTELIAPSDALVDVHGGDLVEALEPFTLHDESPVADRARAMAVAYGLPYVVCPEPDGTAIGGTTSAAAAAAGIPGITPEAGGCGLLEEDAIAAHVRGLGNVLRVLAMLPGEVEPPERPQRLVRRFIWLRSMGAGWWQPDVRPGEAVAAGARLGAVCDLFGEELEVVPAPEGGVPLFVTSSPAVAADGILLGLGAGISEV